jgi:hypothetical protein
MSEKTKYSAVCRHVRVKRPPLPEFTDDMWIFDFFLHTVLKLISPLDRLHQPPPAVVRSNSACRRSLVSHAYLATPG